MSQQQVKIIRAEKAWRFLDTAELVRYKDLFYFLVLRGIKAKYAQSILGVGWAIIQPLFTTLVFTVVFGNLAKISSDGTPYFLFSLCGLVPWTYFAGTLTESSNSLIVNATMITKVYFPRVVLPLSTAFSKALDFLIGFLLLLVVLPIYGVSFSFHILFVPVFLLVLLTFSLGLGMLLSAMAVQYRDIRHALTFLTQILMYGAPVVYPTSNVPEAWRDIYAINPMVGVIEGFRSVLLHTQPIPWHWIGMGALTSMFFFFCGAFYFRRMERVFADVA